MFNSTGTPFIFSDFFLYFGLIGTFFIKSDIGINICFSHFPINYTTFAASKLLTQ